MISRTGPLFAASTLVVAALAVGDLTGWLRVHALGAYLKPLTTLLILILAWRLPPADGTRRSGILAGLALSVAGETLMVDPGTYIAGTWCFVGAQVCYLAALREVLGPLRLGWPLAVHAGISAGLTAIWCALSSGPVVSVAVFFFLLGLLASQAEAWWLRSRGTSEEIAARNAALGALLWTGADTIWTFSLHLQWVPGTFLWVLVLYWSGQWMLSTLAGNAGPMGAGSAPRAAGAAVPAPAPLNGA